MTTSTSRKMFAKVQNTFSTWREKNVKIEGRGKTAYFEVNLGNHE